MVILCVNSLFVLDLSLCLFCVIVYLCMCTFPVLHLVSAVLCQDGGDGGCGHWLVRIEWRPAGWSVCLPLLIFPCTIKSRSSLLAPAHPGGPRKRAVKWLCWCGGTTPRDWLGWTSPKWPILCRVGRKTLTHSFLIGLGLGSCWTLMYPSFCGVSCILALLFPNHNLWSMVMIWLLPWVVCLCVLWCWRVVTKYLNGSVGFRCKVYHRGHPPPDTPCGSRGSK